MPFIYKIMSETDIVFLFEINYNKYARFKFQEVLIMTNINTGVHPTMITPYTKDGEIDYVAVKSIVEWYIEKGCKGIFAVCQSSEMAFLTLEERVTLAKKVVEYAAGRINVVASGHCGHNISEQIREINAISETGIDAFVLVSNRFDLHNEGDDVWIANAERVLAGINPDIKLGIYECPMPYKRLLSAKILDWCIKTGRFNFVKDTCCDPDVLTERLNQLNGTGIMIFNANAQTLLHSLRHGAAGYSGVMANFHPEIYSYLCDNHNSEKADAVQAFLCYYAFSECMSYPVTAKYHMNLIGIPMELDSRSRKKSEFTKYEKMIVEQGLTIEKEFVKLMEI